MKKVVNDPGHGGSDPGAVGNGMNEKDFTLPVALATHRTLVNDYVVEAVLTRSSDVWMSLSARASKGKGADIFISHHADWNASADPRGFWTWRNTSVLPETPGYQEIVHNTIYAYMNTLGVPDRGMRTANHAITRLPPCPTVLIEWLFVSNPIDAGILKNSDYVQKMGEHAAHGIAKALNLPRKEAGQPPGPEPRLRVAVGSNEDYRQSKEVKRQARALFPTHSPFIVLNEVDGGKYYRVILREVENQHQATLLVEAARAKGLSAWTVTSWTDIPFDEPDDESDLLPDGTPIVNGPTATRDQAKQWSRGKNADERFIAIADTYWQYGSQTGINPAVLYAQAALETGYGHYSGAVPPEYNNWAGIKTRDASGDEPEDHEQFSSPEEGVRAHYNHICAYIGQNPIGRPHGRYYVVQQLSWAGEVRFVEELSGKWAPAADYGERVVRLAEEMEQVEEPGEAGPPEEGPGSDDPIVSIIVSFLRGVVKLILNLIEQLEGK